MSNTQKNLNNLPLIERMTASRPSSPVWYQGQLVSAEEAARLKKKAPAAQSIAGLSQHEKHQAITAARKGELKVPVAEESLPTVNGGFVPGLGFVIYGDEL